MRVSFLCAGLLCVGLATIGPAAQFGPPGGGPGARRGPGEPAQPSQIVPSFLQEQLKLTETQRGQLKELQKDVDGQLAKILTATQRQQLQRPNQRGPGGFGPAQGGPPGGAGGPGAPPQPGQVLPTSLQDALKLTDAQRQQLKTLQDDVDTRLAKILTDEQREQLKKLSQGGPGGLGPQQGGPGGGGPGGRPQPGQVLPSFLQEALRLSDAQRQQLTKLQNEVDARLAKILTAMQQQQLQQSSQAGPGGGPPGGGAGGFGPPGGQRGFGGPPQVGQVLSPMQQNELRLSGMQRRQVKELQKSVDVWLAKILTAEQRRQLQPMGRRGPGPF
jgi:Spy/CpxP family protein refolding chaperone